MGIAHELLNNVNDDPDFFKRVITVKESWVYGYDIKTKAHSSHWKSPEELSTAKITEHPNTTIMFGLSHRSNKCYVVMLYRTYDHNKGINTAL